MTVYFTKFTLLCMLVQPRISPNLHLSSLVHFSTYTLR